jgi:hypothetical protein
MKPPMKTTPPSRTPRAPRETRDRAKQNHEQALRACEAAAARIKAAGDELASCWATLSQDISAGVSTTDLLRKRAWCNVLELRLLEEAHALENARHAIDAVWDDMMLTARARELYNRFLKKDAGETVTATEGLPLLARTASAIAAVHRRAVAVKKT